MILIRVRQASFNDFWIESLEGGVWQNIGQAGDAITAEQKRAEAESWRMSKEMGIW